MKLLSISQKIKKKVASVKVLWRIQSVEELLGKKKKP